MANVIENLKYTKEHEWVKLDGDVATIGVTDFAQESLGEVVFVELPEVGDALSAEDSFGVVESIKSVSDLYSPLDGEVVEINEELLDNNALVNESPYENGWMIKLKLADASTVEALMDAASYTDYCANN